MIHSRSVQAVLAAAMSTAFAACATQGIGTGELASPGTDRFHALGPVSFSWESDGASSTRGTITARLADGGLYSGRYLEPTSVLETYVPNWRRDEPGPTTEPVTVSEDPFFVDGVATDHAFRHYSGRLVASLHAADGSAMRCWFHLDRPAAGPAGGAEGTCRLSNGVEVENATLSPAPAHAQPERKVAPHTPVALACSMDGSIAPAGLPAVALDEPASEPAPACSMGRSVGPAELPPVVLDAPSFEGAHP
jgi:hypothetical protein